MALDPRISDTDVRLTLSDASKLVNPDALVQSLLGVFNTMPRLMRKQFERPFLQHLEENCTFAEFLRVHDTEIETQIPWRITFADALHVVNLLLNDVKSPDLFPHIIEVCASGGRSSSPTGNRDPEKPRVTGIRDITGSFEFVIYCVFILWAAASTLRYLLEISATFNERASTVQEGFAGTVGPAVDALLKMSPLPYAGGAVVNYIQKTAVWKIFKDKLIAAAPKSNVYLTFDEKSNLHRSAMPDGRGFESLSQNLNDKWEPNNSNTKLFETAEKVATSMGATVMSSYSPTKTCIPFEFKTNLHIEFSLTRPVTDALGTVRNQEAPLFLCFDGDKVEKLGFFDQLGLVTRSGKGFIADAKDVVMGVLDEPSRDTQADVKADNAFSESLSNLFWQYLASVGFGVFFSQAIYSNTQIRHLSTSRPVYVIAAANWTARTVAMLSHLIAAYYTMPAPNFALFVSGMVATKFIVPAAVTTAVAAAAVGAINIIKKSGAASTLFNPILWGAQIQRQDPESYFSKALIEAASKETGQNPHLMTDTELENFVAERNAKKKAKRDAKERERALRIGRLGLENDKIMQAIGIGRRKAERDEELQRLKERQDAEGRELRNDRLAQDIYIRGRNAERDEELQRGRSPAGSRQRGRPPPASQWQGAAAALSALAAVGGKDREAAVEAAARLLVAQGVRL